MRETVAEIMGGVEHTGRPKKIAPNTVEYLRETERGRLETVVRLHHTDIVVRDDKGRMQLFSGGWQTPTTKERLNEELRKAHTDLRVYSKSGDWLVGSWNGNEAIPWHEGLRIDPNGPAPELTKQAERLIAERKRTAERIKRFVDGLPDPFPLPSSEDCWLCYLYPITPGSRDLNAGIGGHVDCHLKERYYHGSLLVRAMKWGGWGDVLIQMAFKNQPPHREYVKHVLRRYLKRQMGLPC